MTSAHDVDLGLRHPPGPVALTFSAVLNVALLWLVVLPSACEGGLALRFVCDVDLYQIR